MYAPFAKGEEHHLNRMNRWYLCRLKRQEKEARVVKRLEALEEKVNELENTVRILQLPPVDNNDLFEMEE